MIIRSATVADLPRLIILFQQEIAYQREITPFLDVSSDFNWSHFVEVKLQTPNERLIVAEERPQLLGYIDVRAMVLSPSSRRRNIVRRIFRQERPPSFVQSGSVGRIDDCYVEPQFQLRGIGSALLKDGLAWLRARGVTRVDLAVFTANVTGRAFWEKRGFSPYRIVMSKAV
jgi:ribosomal protein S18 acetylase RimI-like enzyme